jgi:hypothetical protein
MTPVTGESEAKLKEICPQVTPRPGLG